MNAPTEALVAPRPERLRLVGQRRKVLSMMHQRLMLGMLVYAGIIALIVGRIVYLAAFGDHAGRQQGVTALVPERGDIVDREGYTLARTIDAWSIGLHPEKVIGDKLALARKLSQLMPERSEADYISMLRSDKNFF
jgi:cell division protein FtsI (penicillin-binding protein 3)